MNERTPTRNEKNPDNRSRWQRFGRTATMIALSAGIGTGIGVAGVAGIESYKSGKEMEQRVDDARHIADRFICDITAVEDTGETPTSTLAKSFGNIDQRTTVHTAVSLEVKDEAKSSLDRYANDDAVIWYAPHLEVRLEPKVDPETGEPKPIYESLGMVKDRDFNSAFDSVPEKDFYPLTTYDDGQKARVLVVQPTQVTGETPIGVTGYATCGELEFDGKTKQWKRAEAERPYSTEFREEELSVSTSR